MFDETILRALLNLRPMNLKIKALASELKLVGLYFAVLTMLNLWHSGLSVFFHF